MNLKKISFFNFRNLQEETIELEKNINLFYGKNGQGKTSLLEAIYFNATGKSFRTKNINDTIKYNEDNIRVYSYYEDAYGEKELGISMNNKKKEYYYNKKKVAYDDFIGKLTIISFIPEDIELVIGPPGLRRSFFDYEISQSDYDYYKILKDFNKILKIRNKFLKDKKVKGDLFEIYNDQFAELSAKLIKKRDEYTIALSRLLNLNYRKLFDNKSELKLKYNNSFSLKDSLDEESNKNEILKILKDNLKKDLYYGYSSKGPQRDEYIFSLKDKEVKSFSSQGEKKSVVFALKIAEIDMLVKNRKEYPVFLMDDVSSYFDSIRKDSIIEYFERKNIQTIITSTDKITMKANTFYIEEGMIK